MGDGRIPVYHGWGAPDTARCDPTGWAFWKHGVTNMLFYVKHDRIEAGTHGMVFLLFQ